ncbi:hypothetical protein QBC34DRAFT_462541 [Podospora aff. communis PSN243]|uniref:DUF7932 domain-containing protein n=1 Tax=Podospora aff. communis PSN243 TaxID=3040156 RepID=A0AAV9GPC9_9PEZI|nr:hypothetical protein QBC34DRAFT_462541 [Podospora aff. communis PSN243]
MDTDLFSTLFSTQNVKRIDSSGRDGQPAADNWDKRAPEAQHGQPGLHGRSAGASTHGAPASDIRVHLTYNAKEPRVVQVAGQGTRQGQHWKIYPDEDLRLVAEGGDGGRGGRGEDGQAGGHGRDGTSGENGTSGEDGEDGGSGGNGGYGSSGADGGAGGNIYVTVREQDADLLLPLMFNVRGGKGGPSGQHGRPGAGGKGGRGGNGSTWTTEDGEVHSSPGGASGRNGEAGKVPDTNLTAGRAGRNGSVQIKVVQNDGTEITYPSLYCLKVVGFDIFDENEDGINESGEHLLVRNIRVRNTGHMPSPKQRSIQLLIRETGFLCPVTTEPLYLPQDIRPGQVVHLPGTLRAFIRHDWTERPAGQALRYEERGVTYIQYPLKLDPPKYLDCVAKGNTVRACWTLHNNSTKSYGGSPRRAAATKLAETDNSFNLSHATENSRWEVVIEISRMEPGSAMTIEQDLRFDENVLEFTDEYLMLNLLLSDPSTGVRHSVVRHQMPIQISGLYSLSPNPSFLLVVNSKTPNHAIHQITNFVRHGLHTSLDIFNLSLIGWYKSPVTGNNVLRSYQGKSIIVFGNSFPFFDSGRRSPWDLFDPSLVGVLAQFRTSLLFAAVDAWASLEVFIAKAVFPTVGATSASTSQKSTKKLVTDLKKGNMEALVTESMPAHRIPVKKGLFSSLNSTTERAARSAAKRLNRTMPMRRFKPGKEGGIIICEGAPKNSQIWAYAGPFTEGDNDDMGDFHMYSIVSCIPFEVKTRMLWNMAGKTTEDGAIDCTALYSGLEEFCCSSISSGTSAKVDAKVLSALCLSIQFTLTSEIYRFTSARPGFPDPIPSSKKLFHLPLTRHFLSAAPTGGQIAYDATNTTRLLVSTLGTIHAQANPLGVWQSIKGAFFFLGIRKGQLTSALNQQLFAALASTCSPKVAARVKKDILEYSKMVKVKIRRHRAIRGPKTFFDFGKAELAGLLPKMVDLSEINLNSKALGLIEFETHVREMLSRKEKVDQMEAEAKDKLVALVNPVD